MENKPNSQQKVVGYQQRVVGYQQRVVGYQQRVAGYQQRVVGHQQRVVGHQQRVVGYQQKQTDNSQAVPSSKIRVQDVTRVQEGERLGSLQCDLLQVSWSQVYCPTLQEPAGTQVK
ncbi:hypothetical protein FHG87_006455 [Trinorchestia longiramus]|nr:hypothetical protein FHG87_006455 [Trinorchestia longiramus]